MMDLLHNYLTHNYLTDVGHWNTWVSHSLSHIHIGSIELGSIDLSQGLMPDDWATTIATKFKETDLSTDIARWWDKTVKTGQVWAFLLGAIFGYLFKTFTTYG